MTSISELDRQRIAHFEKLAPEVFMFACHAAVPLLFSIDLLYQLWVNFNIYTENNMVRKIPYHAVSDLILSSLCQPIGLNTYSMDTEVRYYLKDRLVSSLSCTRQQQVALFLKQYAEKKIPISEKNIKDIHLITAKAIIDPDGMVSDIVKKIYSATNDHEKINFLTLYFNLIQGGSNDRKDHINLVSDNRKGEGIINIALPVSLQNRVRPANDNEQISQNIPLSKEQEQVIEIIDRCIANRSTELDLGNCGLTNNNLAENGYLANALAGCIHVKTLILANSWWDHEKTSYKNSINTGNKNLFSEFPKVLLQLIGLTKLIFCGEDDEQWDIMSMDALYFPELRYLDISNNRISVLNFLHVHKKLLFLNANCNDIKDISALSGARSLTRLLLRNNIIQDLRPLRNLSALNELHLQGNRLSDISALKNLYNLKELWLKDNEITDVSPLSGLVGLKHLGLWDNRITDIIPLKNMKHIHILNLGANKIQYVPKEFNEFEAPILYEERKVIEDKKGIYVAYNPLEYPPVNVIRKGRSAIQQFMRSEFKDRNKIINYITANFLKEQNEYIQSALLVLSTLLEQSWLIFSNKKIFFLQDVIARSLSPNSVRIVISLADALQKIHIIPPDDQGSLVRQEYGRFEIGTSGIWNYSTSLFDEPGMLENAIRNSIIDTGYGSDHKTKKIFISYSWKNTALHDTIIHELKSYPQSDYDLSLWSEKNTTSGEDVARSVQEHIENADLALLFITADYLATIHCVEQMQLIFSLNKPVIPLLFEEYDHEKYPQIVNAQVFQPKVIKDVRSHMLNDIFASGSDVLSEYILELLSVIKTMLSHAVGDSALETNINHIAKEYEDILHNNVDTSHSLALETIKEKIRSNVPQLLPFLTDLMLSEHAGEKFIATILLQEQPNIQYINWLARGVGDNEDITIGDNAALAILKIAKKNIDRTEKLQYAISQARSNIKASVNKYVEQTRILDEAEQLITNVQYHIRAFSHEYEQIRHTQKPSRERTDKMSAIVVKIKNKIDLFLPLIPELTKSRSSGERLIAIIALELFPDIRYIDWLAQRIGGSEKQFIGYHAALSILNATKINFAEHRTELYNAIDLGLSNINAAKRKDHNQLELLKKAKNILHTHDIDIPQIAKEYEEIRKKIKPTDDRDEKFSSVLKKIKGKADQIILMLEELTESNDPGSRLLAIVSLQVFPNNKYYNWLSRHVGNAESTFVGGQSALALLEAAKKTNRKDKLLLDQAIKNALDNVYSSTKKEQYQIDKLTQAKRLLRSV